MRDEGVAAATRRRTSHRIFTAAQLVVAAGIIGWLITTWGARPFAAGARALTAPAILGALALGAAGVCLQAERWRLVAGPNGIALRRLDAVARCYQAAFINAVLPGGLAGDAVRAVEQTPQGAERGATITRSAAAVAAERLAGTAVVFLAAAIALAAPRPLIALACLAVCAAAGGAAWRWLRRLPTPHLGAVAALSVGGWAAFVGLFLLAAAPYAGTLTGADLAALAAITLAGMSVPLNVAGWGPREGAAAFGFAAFGYAAELGVTVSVGYGLLALVSVLPGGAVLLARALRRR